MERFNLVEHAKGLISFTLRDEFRVCSYLLPGQVDVHKQTNEFALLNVQLFLKEKEREKKGNRLRKINVINDRSNVNQTRSFDMG